MHCDVRTIDEGPVAAGAIAMLEVCARGNQGDINMISNAPVVEVHPY